MRAVLKHETHTNSPYIDIAIADAIKHNRGERLWFNGAKYTLTTVDSVYEYPLPADFLGLRGRVYCTPENSTSNGRFPLQSATTDEVETYLYSGAEYDTLEERGTAKRVAIDLAEKRLLVAPIPNPGGDTIFLRYTKDLGTPKYTVSTTSSAPPSLSATVTLLSPTGGTLEASFTNEWFGEGFKLTKERALYELFTRFHSGTEEAQKNAEGALIRYLEELKRLRGETAQIARGTRIRKHFMGD